MRRLLTRLAFASIFVFLCLTLGVGDSQARNPFKNAFFNVYPEAEGTQLEDLPSNANHCGICHFDFDGSETRNPYGLALEIALNSGQYGSTAAAIASLENLDSDNDGFSNLVEITDTVNFDNTPTFPGLQANNVGNAINVDLADLLDYLSPSGGSDQTPPLVTVLSPSGGESYAATSTQLVTWAATDASGIAEVAIYLADESGGEYKPVALGLPDTGSFEWFVPNMPGVENLLKVVARDNANNYGEGTSAAFFTIEPFPGGVVPTTLRDFEMAGTQPLEGAVLENPNGCATCHGDYNHAVEPWHNWAGSMMGQAMRDPHFLATMVIAEQDAPASGDLCLRCHTPGGWQEGRSTDTSGGMVTAKDRNAIQCDFCHRLVDPIYQEGVSPIEDLPILDALDELPLTYANGQFINDPNPIRRGPYADAPADHQFLESPFHRSAELCGICHDVSNPAFMRGDPGDPAEYVPQAFDEAHPDGDLRNMFPVERTYSEWTMSEYASTGVYAPQFAGSKPDGMVSTCQDCHMKDTVGRGADGGPVRTDLALHDLMGGNHYVPDLLPDFFPDEVDVAQLQDAKLRAEYMLSLAATMQLIEGQWQGQPTATVRVFNETGHKLPSGYPEGRRMWLNVKAYDPNRALVYESGAYDFTTADLTHDEDVKIYEIKPGASHRLADALGLEAGPSFHFVLNDSIYSDNRIPPRGFTNAGFEDVQSPPVDYSYDDGQYWDDTMYVLPEGVEQVDVILYYQSTSKEYVEFLRDANVTDDLGQQLYDSWAAHGRAAPVEMVSASLLIEGTALPGDEAPAYEYALSQNVPNPFNPSTRIDYSLARGGAVKLIVYDAAGRALRTLVDQMQGEGPHTVTWNGRGDFGEPMASGIYFYKLETNDYVQTRRMVLIK